ncbi:MAG: DUF2442 domain-containing protein [Cyclobacteriaceae bacterium]|nr:DUF2442 domain-containing protein [Cyclobacteriaceae bacterium]
MNTSTNLSWSFDPIDSMIFEEGLKIVTVFFHKELDVMLILLNNKKLLERKISLTEKLANATEKQLHQYKLSRTGIHWPELDEDLSLRGFLKEELQKAIHA